MVNGGSFAHIGIDTVIWGEPVVGPNVIQYNSRNGIIVERSSSARIAGNDISHNRTYGVQVALASQANLSNNTIDANGGDGVLVSGGSGVNLGADTGDGFLEQPNATKVNNRGFGIRCQVGGYTNGRLGSLNGEGGVQTSSEGCINSLIR